MNEAPDPRVRDFVPGSQRNHGRRNRFARGRIHRREKPGSNHRHQSSEDAAMKPRLLLHGEMSFLTQRLRIGGDAGTAAGTLAGVAATGILAGAAAAAV